MKVNEYLFIDKNRVDSYFEQLRHKKYMERFPLWNFSISATGPKIEHSQHIELSDHSYHSKLEILVKKLNTYLGEIGAIRSKNAEKSQKEFILERLWGRKAVVPLPKREKGNLQEIAIWICRVVSPTRSDQGFRYLIEDFPRADKGRMRTSGFSALRTLLHELKDEMKDTQLANYDALTEEYTFEIAPSLCKAINDRVPKGWKPDLGNEEMRHVYDRDQIEKVELLRKALKDAHITKFDKANIVYQHVWDEGGGRMGRRPHPNGYGWAFAAFEITVGKKLYIAEAMEPEYFHEDETPIVKIWREMERWFNSSPTEFLEAFGARLGDERQIDSLYRIRLSGIAGSGFTVIGYPLCVIESPSTFLK